MGKNSRIKFVEKESFRKRFEDVGQGQWTTINENVVNNVTFFFLLLSFNIFEIIHDLMIYKIVFGVSLELLLL